MTLITILVLSQVAALAALAGALWLVKVKQPIEGRLTFSGILEQRPVIDILLPGQYGVELTNDGFILGTIANVSFKAQVLKQLRDKGDTRFRAVMVDNIPRLASVSNHAESVAVTVWIRKRRALEVLLDSSTMAEAPNNF